MAVQKTQRGIQNPKRTIAPNDSRRRASGILSESPKFAAIRQHGALFRTCESEWQVDSLRSRHKILSTAKLRLANFIKSNTSQAGDYSSAAAQAQCGTAPFWNAAVPETSPSNVI